jgi:hypothetical protein
MDGEIEAKYKRDNGLIGDWRKLLIGEGKRERMEKVSGFMYNDCREKGGKAEPNRKSESTKLS